MSSNGGNDAMHSSDANTNHVPSSYAHTTNPDNTPNTKGYSMLPKQAPRTNRI